MGVGPSTSKVSGSKASGSQASELNQGQDQNPEELSRQRLGLAWDFFMFLLILVNLSWIVFDTFFKSNLVQSWVAYFNEPFYFFYLNQVHPDFLKYDLYFVAIYLVDLGVRWLIAIHRRTYQRWFFFPFANWYDVLGCIPIGSFHVFRLLRVVVIVQRLQRLGFIDFKKTFLYQKFSKYMQIITEEISDRVVIQVINGMQREISQGTPLFHRIMQDVLVRRRLAFGDWVSERMSDFVHASFESRRQEIHDMIHELVTEAASRTDEIHQMQRLPILGAKAQHMLEAAVTSMVYQITEQIMMYCKSDQSTQTVHEFTEVVFNALADPDNQLNQIIQTAAVEALDLVKEQVNIQQWKHQWYAARESL